MAIVIGGWYVRTETSGRHRYWKVGEVDPDRAAQMARDAISADRARAITRISAHALPGFQIAPGVITEIVWETKQVAGPLQMPLLPSQIAKRGAKGEITFDIIVPEDGVSFVEGCYRIDGGNWQVYHLTHESPWSKAPHIRRDTVFSSGISGVSGVISVSLVLNKKAVMEILAEATGVDVWTEVSGPDSLILK
jgi:hypothetical protein